MISFSKLRLSTLPPLPPDLKALDVSKNGLTALPEHLPQGLQELNVSRNKLSALPEHLPQGLQKLYVNQTKLTALPKYLPQNLKFLWVKGCGLSSKALVGLMQSNISIKELDVDRLDIDASAKQELDAELVNNREHPARLIKAAVTLDLLTRFGLTTPDQTGLLLISQ